MVDSWRFLLRRCSFQRWRCIDRNTQDSQQRETYAEAKRFPNTPDNRAPIAAPRIRHRLPRSSIRKTLTHTSTLSGFAILCAVARSVCTTHVTGSGISDPLPPFSSK
jgi:hypothetical protein